MLLLINKITISDKVKRSELTYAEKFYELCI